MCLCKYVSANTAFNILSKSRIGFTQPKAFNDPFDSFPCVEDLVPIDDINKLIEGAGIYRVIDDLSYKAALETIHSTSPEKKNATTSIQPKTKASHLLSISRLLIRSSLLDSTTNRAKQYIQDNKIQSLLEQVGILCLSREKNDLLMWSYYAKSHRGAVIEFDDQHPFLTLKDTTRMYWSGDVEYVEKRPSLKIDTYQDDLSNLWRETFYCKNIRWENEHEYRVIRPLKEAGEKENATLYLFDFPPEMIKSVTFGCRIDDTMKNIIVDLIKTHKEYKHVTLHVTEPDRRAYMLKVNKL